jgi:hypothetical protein
MPANSQNYTWLFNYGFGLGNWYLSENNLIDIIYYYELSRELVNSNKFFLYGLCLGLVEIFLIKKI